MFMKWASDKITYTRLNNKNKTKTTHQLNRLHSTTERKQHITLKKNKNGALRAYLFILLTRYSRW